MLTLILQEYRPQLWRMVDKVFRDEPGVELVRDTLSTFTQRKDLDALIMMGQFAHDQYGGAPRTGVAQVISTKGDPYAPSWVVTTPPFAAHVEMNDTDEITIVRDPPHFAPWEEVRIVFTRIFEAVEQFNATQAHPKICRLGCSLEFVHIPADGIEDDMMRELESIRWAYRDFYLRPPA